MEPNLPSCPTPASFALLEHALRELGALATLTADSLGGPATAARLYQVQDAMHRVNNQLVRLLDGGGVLTARS